MARKKQPTRPAAPFTLSGSLQDVGTSWDDFRLRHAIWLARVDSSEPFYCLPEKCITVLAEPLPHGKPLIDDLSANAEWKLVEICRGANAVGFWQGQPVLYPNLSPRPSRAGLENLYQRANWSESQRREAIKLSDQADGMVARLLGVAGWLRTERAYLDEVDALKQQWIQLPTEERPTFPLGRALKMSDAPEGGKPASPDYSSRRNNSASWCV